MKCNMLKHSYVWVSQERAGSSSTRKGSTVMIKLCLKRKKKKKTKKQQPCVSRGWERNKVIWYLIVTLCVYRFLYAYVYISISIKTHVHPYTCVCVDTLFSIVSYIISQYSTQVGQIPSKFELM